MFFFAFWQKILHVAYNLSLRYTDSVYKDSLYETCEFSHKLKGEFTSYFYLHKVRTCCTYPQKLKRKFIITIDNFDPFLLIHPPPFPCINSNALCKKMRQFEPDKSNSGLIILHSILWFGTCRWFTIGWPTFCV